LLNELFALLQKRGYRRTSLSVQKANPAVRLYQRMGYEIIRENSEDYIMVKNLNCRIEDAVAGAFSPAFSKRVARSGGQVPL
jgi:ribosomal protein S18 acetylase RimI-like enzyme